MAPDTRSSMLSVLSKYPKAVTHLRSRFANQQFGMVLGSGVSRDFQIPDWAGLVSGIASHKSIRGGDLYEKEKEQQSLAALADLLRQSFEERRIKELGQSDTPNKRVRNQLKGEWLNVIREVLYEHCPKQGELEKSHPYLGEFLELIIKCRITINYNFDSCLEMMIDHRQQGAGERGYEVVHDIPTFSGADSAIIYHPNGFIPRNPLDQSSTHIVFSEQEFGDQLMDSIVGRYTALAQHLAQRTCLFLGLSIRDDTLRHLLRKNALSNPGQYHYCVQWVRNSEGTGGGLPPWIGLPAMMKMRISTPHYLDQMKGKASPFGFVLHPRTRDRLKLTLLTPFSKKREGWAHSLCVNTHNGRTYRLEELPRADVISLGDILCGYVNHPEIKSLGPDGAKCQTHTRGLLRRMAINGGLQHCIGKEVSRFEEGKNDFIESVDDMCIHYDGGRVAANESLIAEISARGLRKTTTETGLDRKTIRAILNGKKVKASTLAKVVIGLRREDRKVEERMN